MVDSRWPMLNLMCRQAYEPQLNKQNIFFLELQKTVQILFRCLIHASFWKCAWPANAFRVCVCVFLFSWAQRIAVRGQVRVSIRKLLLTSDFPFSLQDWARDLSLFSILGPYWASRPWFSRARLSTSFQSFAEHIAFLLGHIAATS